MSGASLDFERGHWSVAGRAAQIEYALSVLDQIRVDAIEGFNKVPHGGIEIGGVLFGERGEKRVSILAARPLACEYALGPSFVLSEKDQAALRELLAASRQDPDVRGLQPVGWYHSHTRSEISLSERDIQLFNQYFPEPWQIALVVRPANFAPTRGGFFFRESDGTLHAERSYLEFVIPAIGKIEAAPRDVAPAREISVPAEPQPSPPPVVHRKRWKAYAVMAAWLLLTVAAAIASRAFLLDLGRWRQWQPAQKSSSIDTGQLRIRQLEMEAELLRQKLNEQAAQNNRLAEIVTTLQNQATVPVIKVPVPVRNETLQKSARNSQQTAARLQPSTQSSQKQAPSRPISVVNAITAQPNTGRVESQTHSQTPPNPPPARLQVPAAPIRNTAPPEIAPPPVVAVSSKPTSLPGAPVESLAKPAPPPPVHNTAPKSGRLIWTGRLPKNGLITIQGKSTSAGSLTGELPARPVHLTVYPADFSGDSLVLYSSNSKYAKNALEPPGPQNGWNQTLYTWDPHHAKNLVVAETPGPQNGWSRLVLQNKNTAVSVIVIDWTLQ